MGQRRNQSIDYQIGENDLRGPKPEKPKHGRILSEGRATGGIDVMQKFTITITQPVNDIKHYP